MSATPDRGDDSFEVDRHVDDQPVRDDIIEPEDIDPAPVEEPTMDEEVGEIPGTEELPETQGVDVLSAQRVTEDAKEGPVLSDERAEDPDLLEEIADPTHPDIAEEQGLVDPTDTP